MEPLVACIAAHSSSSPADSFFAYVAWEFGWSRMGSDVASIADKYRRQVTMSECYIYKVHNQLTIYCVPPARALKGHHKYSYQSIRALHDPYICTLLYLILFGYSILPVDIACAPSTETFKSRLIEAIRTGAIVVALPRTVTTIHAGMGARGQPLQAF